MKSLFLLGRVIFGGFFIYNGIHHFQERRQLAQYAGAKNVPLPDVAVAVTGAEMVLGGASVLLGIKPRAGAALIAGFLAGVSPMMHDFWKHEDPQQRMNEMVNFSKNIALLGAALMIMSMEEPWPASIPVAQPDTGFSNLVA